MHPYIPCVKAPLSSEKYIVCIAVPLNKTTERTKPTWTDNVQLRKELERKSENVNSIFSRQKQSTKQMKAYLTNLPWSSK